MGNDDNFVVFIVVNCVMFALTIGVILTLIGICLKYIRWVAGKDK